MRVQDVAKLVMKLSSVTQKEMAEKYGKAGQSTISMILRGNSMKVEALLMILEACDYELVARSKDGVRPEYVIGDGEGETIRSPQSEKKMREMIREIVREELGEQKTTHFPIEFAPDLDGSDPKIAEKTKKADLE